MDMMRYELIQGHIADLKALKNQPKTAMQGTGLWESLKDWWQSLTFKEPAQEVSPSYRTELMRQEWMVASEPLNNTKC